MPFENLEAAKDEGRDLGFRPFMYLFQGSIDFEAVENREYRLKPEFDEKLMEINKKIQDLKAQLQKAYKTVLGP